MTTQLECLEILQRIETKLDAIEAVISVFLSVSIQLLEKLPDLFDNDLLTKE